jgi:hypothetical protein
MEKHSTGAATLLMSMLAKAATSMLAIRTVRGWVPALLRTKVAILLSIFDLDKIAARVKPPRRSMMTCDHMAEKMKDVAAFDPIRLCGLASSRTTFRRTHRKGISNEVTNSGIALAGKSVLAMACLVQGILSYPPLLPTTD